MRIWIGAALAAMAVLMLAVIPFPSQAQAPYKAPKAADGHPDLGGIWQYMGSANWDLQDHAAERRSACRRSARSGRCPRRTRLSVEGDEIPYLPGRPRPEEAEFRQPAHADPEAKCYLPGIPRANYMPYPFQIVQSPRGHSVRLRVCYRESHGEHGQAGPKPVGYLDGDDTTGAGKATRWWSTSPG